MKLSGTLKFISALLLAVALPAMAGTISYTNTYSTSGYTFDSTLTVDNTALTYTYGITISNTGGATANLTALSAALFTNNLTISSVGTSIPSGWQYYANEKINNGVSAGASCPAGGGGVGSVCADDQGTSPFVLNSTTSTSVSLQFSGAYTGGLNLGNGTGACDNGGGATMPCFHLMANGDQVGSAGTGNVFALSNDLYWTPTGGGQPQPPPPSTVPEPGSMALVGTGIAGVATAVRRKLVK